MILKFKNCKVNYFNNFFKAKIASDLNFGTEYANMRNSLGFVSSIIAPTIGVKVISLKFYSFKAISIKMKSIPNKDYWY